MIDRRKRVAFLSATSLAAGLLLAPAPAFAACTVNGTTAVCDDSAPNPWVLGATLTADTIEVTTGATVTSTLGSSVSPVGTTVAITNSGTIQTTNTSGRAINFAGADNSRDIVIANNAGGLITSADDAVRINFDPSGGTIRLDNRGTISTTSGGQALDFNAAESGDATILINNYATGVLRSFGQDAIRPGQGAIVTNAGLIYSDGLPNNSIDGIDWQESSGTVANQAGGTISGLRHGITSDVDVNITNQGTIIGRNGSGVGSDGVGTVVNRGTVTGQWDGVATNGDGDGVDIDGIGTIRNFGTIQGLTARGVDSGGSPNSAEGIAMGGGLIENNVNAVISGGGSGILVDNGSAGGALGATTIVNNGVIRGGTGYGITLVGDFADTVTNNGLISGGAGALSMGGGNDSLVLLAGAQFVGQVDGGQGTDTVTLRGLGGSLDRVTNFESLIVEGAGWTLARANSFANGMSILSGGSLIGNAANLTGAISNAGTLIVDQSGDGAFAGTLIGGGTLVKRGAGTLVVGGQSRFTGTTLVQAGRLALAGTLPGAVQVQSGGTLGGNGTVGILTVNGGATVAPGNSIGTINVTGNFAQLTGSLYIAETSAAGTSDLIAVAGTAAISPGAQLFVTRDAGAYTVGQRFTVLTAAGGIAGDYALVQGAPVGGTEFRLGRSANAVYVDLARTAGSLYGLSRTHNQFVVSPAVAALGLASPIYANLTLNPDDEAVRKAFDGLSGEIHASLLVAMAKDAQAAQDAIDQRLAMPAQGLGIWGQYLHRDSSNDSKPGIAGVDRDTDGAIGGIDMGLAEIARIGIAAGYSETTMQIVERTSRAKLKATHVAAYGMLDLAGFTARGTLGYVWGDNDTARAVAFTGFSDSLSASYKGKTLHGIGDLSYAFPFAGGKIEPFAGFQFYRVKADAFTETGGAAALAGEERSKLFKLSTLGVRAETRATATLSARAKLGWQHAYGDLDPKTTMRFVAGGPGFQTWGVPMSKEAAVASLDLVWTPIPMLAIAGGYSGYIGSRGGDNAFRLTASLGF
jgi:autotransporter-associated beta strand protein